METSGDRDMNERIRELAEQAWFDTKEEFDSIVDDEEFDSIVDDGGSINFTFAHDDQKFAELIVRECADIANGLAVPTVALRIKEHFGVKE
jgi:hypothetical protein